jgi:hypothetical protein
VLYGAIGTWEEQGGVAILVPSDEERLGVVRAARFKYLALSVMVTGAGAVYYELIA